MEKWKNIIWKGRRPNFDHDDIGTHSSADQNLRNLRLRMKNDNWTKTPDTNERLSVTN